MHDIAPISRQIWDMKYRLKQADGEAVDKSLEETWQRIARSAAALEKNPEFWIKQFYESLKDFGFLPAGRIVAGVGTGRSVTLFNCFVMGTIEDDLGGIFAHLREAALTLQQGGGIGYDFSTLRPKGAPVLGVAADASGPLSFMDVWDSMCRTIMSAGSRRGAMMATLCCDHPDIEAFIDAKREPNRLRMFNLSVLVSDAFMEAVQDGSPWPLSFGGKVFRVVEARALWDQIMRATYDAAEPGVIFIDRINKRNNLWYCETISATNPCGEQPLPPYGACLLGSINLAALVQQPFETAAALDEKRLASLVTSSIRLLDNIIDVSRFPLPQQEEEAHAKRRIGLGVTGLADALILLGIRYGSAEAVQIVEHWMTIIQRSAYLASANLAREKGAFPLYDRDKFLAGETTRSLDADVRDAIAAHGIRNALLTSIAPTGTISLLADNVSSGIEPVFSFTYSRAVLMPDGTRQIEEVSDFAYRLFRKLYGPDAPLPAAFVDTQSLTPDDHLVMQAAVQRHVDSSISKTINLPADIPFDAFKHIYLRAYADGCKGCTTYRPNEITGSVLTRTETLKPANADAAPIAPEISVKEPKPLPADVLRSAPDSDGIYYMTQPLSRPEVLPGQTYKLRWPESDHAMYITLNDIVQDGRRRPFEVFINSKNMDHYAWTVGLTRMISAVFRRGGDITFVVEELKAVFDPRGGAWMTGRYVPSLLAAIGNVVEQHMIEIGFIAGLDAGAEIQPTKIASVVGDGSRLGSCPRCGNASLIRQEGCAQCTSCSYSKCG